MKKGYFLFAVACFLTLSNIACASNHSFEVEPVEQSEQEMLQTQQAETSSPEIVIDAKSVEPSEEKTDERRSVASPGANINMGGLMSGDGEGWIYYRSEENWGLYKARTDGTEVELLLPAELYTPASINVVNDWIFFSNACDGFSIYRVKTDGTGAEKLIDGYCYKLFATENGIYFDERDDDNRHKTQFMKLDGSDCKLIAEGYEPVSYYSGTLYLYNFVSKSLSVYDESTGDIEELTTKANQAAYFSADETGIYYWNNMSEYCRIDAETREKTVLKSGPIGDYYNYCSGKLYYVAYGGENFDYICVYEMDVTTGEEIPILSLSAEEFDPTTAEPLGITQTQYRSGNYDPEIIPADANGFPLIIDERAFDLYIANGEVFARGRMKESRFASCWIYCDGKRGTLWG